MNKRVYGRKLSRSRPAREALFSTFVRSVILTGKIETTYAKAKAVQPDLEKMVTLAKKGTLASRRAALTYLDNARNVTDLLFQKVAPSFSTRTSGYTRITRLARRSGDNAQIVKLEWTDKIEMAEKPKTEKSKLQIKSEKTEKAVKGKEKA